MNKQLGVTLFSDISNDLYIIRFSLDDSLETRALIRTLGWKSRPNPQWGGAFNTLWPTKGAGVVEWLCNRDGLKAWHTTRRQMAIEEAGI